MKWGFSVPLLLALACIFGMVALYALGLKPDKPPTLFMGTPFMGRDILLALVGLSVLFIAAHIVIEEREFRQQKRDKP